LTAVHPQLPVYFALREFEVGWRPILPELGFKMLTSQTLVVKHMAVRVRKVTPALIPALEQTPTEGAATTVMSPIELTQAPVAPKHRRAQRPDHQIFTSVI
jgi:hypothetical protein